MTQLFVCGVVIVASFSTFAVIAVRDGSPLFFGLIGISVLAYVAALIQIIGRVSRAVGVQRNAFRIALALALAMRLPGLYPDTGPGSDMFRYFWDARVQRHGLNPYTVVPADPAYAALHSPDTRLMNNMHLPSPYPPATQLFFRMITSVSESPRAIKAALIVADLLTSILLMRLLRTVQRSESLALMYAWHPLTILESSRNGHLDALGTLLLVCAALWLVRGRRLASVLTFVTAIAVKPLPIVLVPLLWKRVRLWHVAAGGALLAALYAPYMFGGGVPIGAMADVVKEFRFNAPFFERVERVLDARAAAALAVAMGLAAASWLRVRLPAHAPEAWAWPMAIALIGAPIIYPWYLVWLVPFLWTRHTLPLLVWTVIILATYVVWALPPGVRWAVPNWVLVVEYGLFLATVFVSLRLWRRVR